MLVYFRTPEISVLFPVQYHRGICSQCHRDICIQYRGIAYGVGARRTLTPPIICKNCKFFQNNGNNCNNLQTQPPLCPLITKIMLRCCSIIGICSQYDRTLFPQGVIGLRAGLGIFILWCTKVNYSSYSSAVYYFKQVQQKIELAYIKT